MAPKDIQDCGKCKDKLPKNGDHAVCSTCANGFHFEVCCGLKKKTWTTMGPSAQAAWVCTECRKKRKNSVDEDENEEDFEVSGMGVQKSILAKVNSLLDMKTKIESIESSMSLMAEVYDKMLKEVSELRHENKALREELECVKASEKDTKTLANRLAYELAELDQYGRRVNLEIHGVKVLGDLQKEDTKTVLQGIAEDIGVVYEQEKIHQAHRLQPRQDGKPPAIIVQFHSKDTRDTWLVKGSRARLERDGRKIFFNENLCQQYRLLFREAKLKASTYQYKFVWFRGGKILVKKGEDSRNVIVVRCREDLNKIK